MLLVLFLFIFLFCYGVKTFITEPYHRCCLYLFIAGFSFYSCLGIVINDIENSWVYFGNYILFSIVFFIVGYKSQFLQNNYLQSLDFLVDEYSPLFVSISAVYIGTFVFQMIYSGVSFESIFNLKKIFAEYSATAFSIRVDRQNDVLYTIVVNQIRALAKPFFYVTLFIYRKKTLVFISLFLFPVLLQCLANNYMSRNNLAIYVLFVYVYLILEDKINRKIGILLFIIAIPSILSLFYVMASMRLNSSAAFSLSSLWDNIYLLIKAESGFPQYYSYCERTNVSAINFFIYILIVYIPSQLYKVFGLSVPNLAYSFTETVLGMKYGALNYYILLPSVLGEALILLGRYFAWLYAFFYGFFVFLFLRILVSSVHLKYLLLFFLLDFFRQFRGGSQFVLTSWMTTLVPFIVLILLLNLFVERIKK